MKRSPSPKTFVLLTLGAMALGGFASYYQLGVKGEQESAVSKLKAQVKPKEEVEKELTKSTEQVTVVSTQLKHLEANIPEFAYIPTLLQELERTGKEQGIEILGVRPMPKASGPATKTEDGAVKRKKAYEEQDIEIKARGTYGDAMRLMQALNTFPKIIAVRTVTMIPKAAQNGEPKNRLDITIEVRAYVFPPNATKTAGVEGQSNNG
ncbi:MAG: type 4a pilus biogenesis protein PilO [Armatimonadetes bacterium]|nr:type 4a pilus biogenesis protein PilO [Armatimonadota bacterium]